MSFPGNRWDKNKMVPSVELLERLSARYPGLHRAQDELNDTARTWQIPGYKGSLGFISSMSDHFCSSCNRLRITADGQIKVTTLKPSLNTKLTPLSRSVYLIPKKCLCGTKCAKGLPISSYYNLSAKQSSAKRRSMLGWKTSMLSRIGP